MISELFKKLYNTSKHINPFKKGTDFLFIEPMEIHQCIDGEKGLKMICVIPNKDQPYLTCEG